MIICIDIDGVLAVEMEQWWNYQVCEVVDGARESLQLLKKEGHILILHTARLEIDKDATEDWLKKNEIPYDDLVLGKPRARFYIDDRALTFDNWDSVLEKVHENTKEDNQG